MVDVVGKVCHGQDAVTTIVSGVSRQAREETTDERRKVVLKMMIFHSTRSWDIKAVRCAGVAAYLAARQAYTIGSPKNRVE